MSRRKLERLLNLTMCLMSTRRFLTVEEIGRLVDGYDPDGTAEEQAAFRRMFERDKEDLRDLGVPLVTGSNSAWDDEIGYRIARSDYALPDIDLDPDEASALALAARLWSSASLAGASISALRKLQAAGVDPVPPPPGLEPRVDAREPAFEPLLDAVRDGRVVRFPYRRPPETEPRERTVEPWGVVSWHGHWYLVGHDRDRDDTRVFRLSRVTGPVRATGPAGTVTRPPDVDLRAEVADSVPVSVIGTATLLVRQGAGHSLRRTEGAQVVTEGTQRPGYDTLTVPYADLGRLTQQVLWYGSDVVAVDPPELRERVIERLRAVAGEAS
jgi:predicted DNA-binding transcriptional regulator YafY